jgi:flagellar hook assembly protein FlgD
MASVFDVAGRRLATVSDDVLPAGRHRIEWDARDARGTPVPSGVYFLRVEAGDRTFARKVSVVR